MSSLHCVSHAEVLGFGQLDEDGSMMYEAYDPEMVAPLILLKCKPNKGTSFHILTNGDEYYPIGGKSNLTYAPSLIHAHGPLSELDQLLIKEAVRYFSSLFI